MSTETKAFDIADKRADAYAAAGAGMSVSANTSASANMSAGMSAGAGANPNANAGMGVSSASASGEPKPEPEPEPEPESTSSAAFAASPREQGFAPPASFTSSAPPGATALPVSPSAPVPAQARDALAEWRGRLLDLTLRNNLTNMKEGPRLAKLRMPAPAAVRMLADEGSLSVDEGDKPAFAELARQAASHMSETGNNALYLALYSVSWTQPGRDDAHEAPLVLLPARIVRDRAANTLAVEASVEDMRVNVVLAELMRRHLGVDLPHAVANCAGVVSAVRTLLKPVQGWSLHEQAAVGLFSFARAVMYEDLAAHDASHLRNSVVRALQSGTFDQAHRVCAPQGQLNSAGSLLPLPTDSSQLQAVQMSARGKSFVLVGPPGTGKSQTIANMTADAMAHGKTVLVVSKKAAALDVVRDRLSDVGLGSFCLSLYGTGIRKRAFSQLKHALEGVSQGVSADVTRYARELARLERELDAYAQALEKPLAEGIDVRDAIARYVAVRDASDDVTVGDDALASLRSEGDVERARFLIERMGSLAKLLGVESREDASSGRACEAAARRRALTTPVAPEADEQAWSAWRALEAEVRACGLGSAARVVLRGVPVEQVKRSFEKAFYGELCKRAMQDVPVLDTFSGAVFDQAIEQYEHTEAMLREQMRTMVANSLAARARATCEDALYAEQVSALKRSVHATSSRGARKSARARAGLDAGSGAGSGSDGLRSVLQATRNVIVGLCPCVLSTPLGVAQHFSWDAQFDLVIFDEASQLETAEAVCVLERAEQVVVAGDPQQMPPSTFFESGLAPLFDELGGEAPTPAAYADGSSLLEDCLALGLPRVDLTWHYRSRHESLIAFSNERFYEGKLHTFPSPDARVSKVSLRKVNAVYAGGGVNEVEARAVASHVRERFEAGYAGSVGVITFSVRQQHAVEQALRDELGDDVEFAQWLRGSLSGEPLLVKSLENMQGDECDLVLLSVAYGPNERGVVAQRFGPINSQGGERRLNVAFTRARCEMVVFSSMTSAQVNACESSPEGVRVLQDFLAYAEGGGCAGGAGNVGGLCAGAGGGSGAGAGSRLGAGGSTVHAPRRDPLAASLASALEQRGWIVELDVGASDLRVDLAVCDPYDEGRYMAGVLLDGAPYRFAHTTRDRDLGRDEALERLGWTLCHVWAADCVRSFDFVVARVDAFLQENAPLPPLALPPAESE